MTAVLVVLLVPACNLTYVPDPGQPGGSGALPFLLILPIDGELQATTNPQFAWNALDGSTSYQLQVSTASDFSQIVWDDTALTITSTFLTQVTLTNFTTYYWRIYGIQPGGAKVLAGGSPSQFRTQGGGFTIPTSFATRYPNSNLTGVAASPMFAWQASIGATSYTVEVDPSGTFTPPLFAQANIHVNRATLNAPLAPGTVYSWRVLATGQLGNTYSDVPPAVFSTAP
jgi:hypothetical protein